MAHLPDNSECWYVSAGKESRLISVGWLSRQADFQQGEVSEKWFARLCDHVRTAWTPPYAYAGVHECEFCQFGRSSTRYRDVEFSSSSGSELFFPAGEVIFVTPVNIVHYIACHRYLPPEKFMEAVAACPPQRSTEFLQLLLNSGGREWLSALEEGPEPN